MNKYPYIIAEAGVNHNGSLDAALRLVDIARVAGADCIKFQAYTADDLVIRKAPKAEYQKDSGDESLYEMLLKYELKQEDFQEINNYCLQRNIDFLITPFSPKWVDIFYNMGVKMLKVSSGDLRSKSLLKKIGMTGLPVILSTGMSVMDEIRDAINILRNSGCRNLSLLHCVSLYPTPLDKINLFSINALKKEFCVPVGLSDHTSEVVTGKLAVVAGAVILEKHFTINKKDKGPDHKMSLSPHELKKYIEGAREVVKICGNEDKKILKEEIEVKKVSQLSLVAARLIKKGEIICSDALSEKRPSTGISPMEIDNIIGKIAIKDIKNNEILTYGHFKKVMS